MLDKKIYENLTINEKTEVLKKEALDLISKTNFSEYNVEFKEVANFDTMEVHICVHYDNCIPVDMQLLFSNNTAKIGVQYESDEIMYFGRWVCTISVDTLSPEQFNAVQEIVDKVAGRSDKMTEINIVINNGEVSECNVINECSHMEFNEFIIKLDEYLTSTCETIEKAEDENKKLFNTIKENIKSFDIECRGDDEDEELEYETLEKYKTTSEYTIDLYGDDKDGHCLLHIDALNNSIFITVNQLVEGDCIDIDNLFGIEALGIKDIPKIEMYRAYIILDKTKVELVESLLKKIFELNTNSEVTIIETEHTSKVINGNIKDIIVNNKDKIKTNEFGEIIISKTIDSIYN